MHSTPGRRSCRCTTFHLCLILALACLFAPQLEARSHAPEASTPTIPAVHATALSGDPVNLPEALQGKIGILILGFSEHSRDQVTPWGKRLATDYRTAPRVLYYEMPVLASVPHLLRPMVLHSLKSSVPERAQPRFVPVTEDERRWQALTHYTSSAADDAYLLVVWRTQGPPTDTTYAALKQQIDTLSTHL